MFGGRGGFAGTGLAIEKRTILYRLITGTLRVTSRALGALATLAVRTANMRTGPRVITSVATTSRATATLTRIDENATGELTRRG